MTYTVTVPFWATTITQSNTPLTVFTDRSFTSAPAVINGVVVNLPTATSFRFRDLVRGWLHLDTEEGFIPLSYIDIDTIALDKVVLRSIQQRSNRSILDVFSVEDSIVIPNQRLAATDTVCTILSDHIAKTAKSVYGRTDIEYIVSRYGLYASSVSVDWVGALAQAIHETGWFSSWWSQPPRHNMAGIGVTGDMRTDPPQSGQWAYHEQSKRWYRGFQFQTIDDGITHHIALLLIYAVHPDRMTDVQRDLIAQTHFAPFYRSHRYAGKAPRWVDLNGRWAVPGTEYGQRITAIARRLLRVVSG